MSATVTKVRPSEQVDEPLAVFAADVHDDLQKNPRQLQPKYFYDALGSHLFESICHLPWYLITRAERRLLEEHAADMLAPLDDLTTIIELGCGSGAKLALLAEGVRKRAHPVLVRLIDISATALDLSERTLGRLPHVSVVGRHEATYDAGLREATRPRPSHGSTLVLFLGSNLGNLRPAVADAFLREVRSALRPGDGFLLGADLVKPEKDLLLAYGDPLGVTAAFNKNILDRINRELGGDFDLDGFQHRPRWNPDASRVESHLVSMRAQKVTIPEADLSVDFAEGESIWTESSYKYTPDQVAELGAAAAFRRERQWIEPESQFSLTLFVAE